ncbi:asparaginase [Desmospora profundinema]|uniref:asparaginase n=1 Tax=Desmospora profundinema TaxID=1571184 RepID=A0ABU1IU36_9BACL|nr:asparaginase [Desmospora profundinema]MDR6227275.1 L-asparaginase [Desmospora profundinema]
MKKLLLLTTGGTIASVDGKDGLAPGMTAADLLGYLPQSRDYDMEHQTLMNIDSTNMQPELWAQIAETIAESYHRYDGFVITHGTDTMAYTSAALSYMLQNGTKPIVITGSQVPIHYDKTDAKKNILDAARFACEDIGGVYMVFDGRVIQGTRAVKMRTKSYDAFESINHPYVAFIHQSEVHYHKRIPSTEKKELKLDTSLCPDVFVMKLYPGTKPELFDCIKGLYKGVIIESYGNGGIPFEKRDLLPKLKEMIASEMAVVITTQCLEEGEDLFLYEVGRKVAQNLIILSRDMNTEAMVAKLMWTLGKTNDLQEVKRIMETPIAHDLSLEYQKESG